MKKQGESVDSGGSGGGGRASNPRSRHVACKRNKRAREMRACYIKINKNKELIWILEHEEVYTGGTSFSENEILDKSINFIKTNRGGKITYHGPGQLVFYFAIDLSTRGKNIKKIITAIEKTIIDTLKIYNIKCFADRKNIGIWFENKSGKLDKIAAIGIKVKKWIV